MAEPLEGLNVKFSTKSYELNYIDNEIVFSAPNSIKVVTNLAYETKLNDEKDKFLY